MTGPIINTPKGSISLDAKGMAKLEFNTSFQPRFQRQYSRAQKFLDGDILRGCEPYVPLLTGVLRDSGILGTDIGSGLVQWIAPYAKYQYYSPRKPGSSTGPQRGPYWFERWKAEKGRETIAKARSFAGGG